MTGSKVDIPYEKHKSVEWTVEDMISNKNIHAEESGDFYPIYDYLYMDPIKINP